MRTTRREPIARREFLVGLTAGTAVLAGCLGGEGGDGTDDVSLPAPTLGRSDATVTVTAFTDFACPHCKHWHEEVLPSLRTEYVDPGTARYVHKDFPIPVHARWSWDAAEAARAVQDRASETYFEFASGLYEMQGSFSLSGIRSLADEVGVDGDAVGEDVTADVYKPVVRDDREDGTNRGVGGTPTVFVDGKTVEPSYSAVASAIESAAQ